MTASSFVLDRTKYFKVEKRPPAHKLSSELENFGCSKLFSVTENNFDALWNWIIN